jgi:hypothetical protein
VIRHLVLFKLNEGVSRDEPRVVAGARAFAELGGLVPEVASWETGWNVSDRPVAYDFAINSSVADADALRRYLGDCRLRVLRPDPRGRPGRRARKPPSPLPSRWGALPFPAGGTRPRSYNTALCGA